MSLKRIINEPKRGVGKTSIDNISKLSKPIFVCYYDYNEKTGKTKVKVINGQGTELFTKYNDLDTINLNGIETTMPYEKNLLKYKQDNKYGEIEARKCKYF